MSVSCRRSVSTKRKARMVYHDTVSLFNKKRIYASLADERAYGQKTIVKLRKMIKQATSSFMVRIFVTIALMLGYKVESRRGKIQIFEKEPKTRSRSKSAASPGGDTITDAMRAMQFYMCFRFRKDENPAFEYLNKDTALLICYSILKKQVDALVD